MTLAPLSRSIDLGTHTAHALAFGWLQSLYALVTVWQLTQEEAQHARHVTGQSEVLNVQCELSHHALTQVWQHALDALLPRLETLLEAPSAEACQQYAALWHEVQPSLHQALMPFVPHTPWQAPQALGYATCLETLLHVQPGTTPVAERSDFWPYTSWMLSLNASPRETFSTLPWASLAMQDGHPVLELQGECGHGALIQSVSPFLITAPQAWLTQGTTRYLEALASLLLPVLQARAPQCRERIQAFEQKYTTEKTNQAISTALETPSTHQRVIEMLTLLLGVMLWGVPYAWSLCYQAWQATWQGDKQAYTWLNLYEPLIAKVLQTTLAQEDLALVTPAEMACFTAWRGHWQCVPPIFSVPPTQAETLHDALWVSMSEALQPFMAQYPFFKTVRTGLKETSLLHLVQRFQEGVLPCVVPALEVVNTHALFESFSQPEVSRPYHTMTFFKERPVAPFDILRAYVFTMMQDALAVSSPSALGDITHDATREDTTLMAQCQKPQAFQQGVQAYAWRLSVLHKALETVSIHQALVAS
ncbi:MAG: hypothetical protein ACKO37_05650 [Vampirovibrionales bacterium]